MAALPSPTQVAGTHSAIYEAYYNQVDPNGSGVIQALDAARFLKKSRLSDVILSKIWDLSDPNGKGYLDKAGLFVALKLVALAQAGKDISMSNIQSEAPPPKLGELPKVPPMSVGPPARPAAPSPVPPSIPPVPPGPPTAAVLSDWSMKPHERDKYSQLFDSLQPNNGLIAGNKVKGVLMESKLPMETLGKIWDLADQDRDGMLDRHEFMVAMHLVYKALEKHAVPTTLPPELRPRAPPSRPPSRPPSPQPRPPPPRPHPPPQQHSNSTLLEGLLDLSTPTQAAPSSQALAPLAPLAQDTWVVSAAEKAQYDAQFALADQDRDGYVSGVEIKHAFLESGLPQSTLAHIWALCDTDGLGKLSREQYALAMWLVAGAVRGVPPPAALPHHMVPPAHREQQSNQSQSQQPLGSLQLGAQPTPEMEAIAREVEALARERLALDAEVADKQRALTTAAAEGHALQSELDTLTATLKQLENQKGEAQKRLNDLKTQVEKLRSQVSAQEVSAAETAAEVGARRAAAHTLREKEQALHEELAGAEADAEALTSQLRKTVLALSQANIKISHLEEQHRVVMEACEALSSDGVSAALLALQPLHAREHLERVVRGATPNDALEDESFPQSNGFDSDPFKESPFTSATQHDPFAPSTTSTASTAATANTVKEGFASDPFASDADPFAGDAFTPQTDTANTNDHGAWTDPFAVLHAPAREPNTNTAAVSPATATNNTSTAPAPAPALPPKRHKTPPPRPAPPRQDKTDRAHMDFTDDPFKDYRYEDPFNIADPFADATAAQPTTRADFGRPTSVAGFETDDFFASSTVNGSFTLPEKRSGRVSAPPVPYDPFSGRSEFNTTNNNESWAAWPNDNWATDSAWTEPTKQKADAWSTASKNTNIKTNDRKTDNWANKSDNWATDWNIDQNKNLNETWPNTLPSKKEKSPRPVKYAKSLVHTIGGIGRSRQKKAKAMNETRAGALGVDTVGTRAEALPSEEAQWAWAAAESRRLERAADEQRKREDAELQLALAISRQDK